jgi:hypothetical protein
MECYARSGEVRDWEDQPADQGFVKGDAFQLASMEFNGEVEYANRETEPQTWAERRVKAADRYLHLVDAAERKANMEKVIAHYLAAAEVLTKEEFPERWAEIQMSLCDAYLQRVEGIRRENMENAMRCFNACKEVRGDDPLPADWLKQQWEKGAEAAAATLPRRMCEARSFGVWDSGTPKQNRDRWLVASLFTWVMLKGVSVYVRG